MPGTTKKNILVVFGTRPEAIKMVPVILALRESEGLRPVVVVTGQHREMLDQVLVPFGIMPDADLNVMRPSQAVHDVMALVLQKLPAVFREFSPHMSLVHGDTTTTLAGALSAFYSEVPVAHVEAGLRSGSMQAPWPEEMNRRLTAPLCSLHFAPTENARINLLREGIPEHSIIVTGNTVIDALMRAEARLASDIDLQRQMDERFAFLAPGKRLVLVTGHRRENLGDGFMRVFEAIRTIAAREDVQVVYPVHLNPGVRGPALESLSGLPNVYLTEPQPYLPFVYLLKRSALVLTDSGGVQEEAPAFGKTVLVMRELTERPEALALGGNLLVGTDPVRIAGAAFKVLDEEPTYVTASEASRGPFGDGNASARIVHALSQFLDANTL